MEDYTAFLESAKEIALRSGAMVRSKSLDRHDIHSKSKFDFVTEVDALSEKMITTYLKEKYPEHLFFGEEEVSSSLAGEEEVINNLPSDRYIWVIDPIDGTTNFIRNTPLFAISIALIKGSEVIVGVIYDISRDELYYTKKGDSSYCNEKVIHVSDVSSFESAIGITSFPTRLDDRHKILSHLTMYGDSLMSLRIYNCAALACCNIASGRADCYVELGIHLWDFSAGKLLIENAGGRFTDIDGREYHLKEKHVVASNGRLHEKLLDITKLLN